MSNKKNILVIDDDVSTVETLDIFITGLGYDVSLAYNGREGLKLFDEKKPDLVLTDMVMPELGGMDVLKKIKENKSGVPVIIITAVNEMDTIISAIQEGAYDYVEKPIDISNLKVIIKNALETSTLEERLEDITKIFVGKDNDDDIIVGNSPLIKEILKKIGKISSSRVNVLIQGESGTGKELISRTIHYSGVTKDKPFIAVNSAALPETLLESELFGHVKGSFTGAIRDKKGKFELAENGTIFLDEIADISPSLQVKLLRVIQEREFERVGGETTISMNARIIAATNKNLEKLVKEGKFREDLYYRLNVFTINVPPLRERKSDISLLVIHILKKINKELHKNVIKIPYEVIDILQNYKWVGNVRELGNILMQAVLLAKGDVLEKENILLSKIKYYGYEENLEDFRLSEVENMHIKYVLDKVNWNKTKAAKLLGISKQTLYTKIKAYSISPT
ncbi:MAG: sigma-54 dependent transcriptional regulator [Ignavibacteriaceae bacterium]